jgi:hypothetical protein
MTCICVAVCRTIRRISVKIVEELRSIRLLESFLISFNILYIRTGLENRDYGRRDSSRWPRGTFYSQKLALTSLTSGGRSVGIVRLRTQATEFFFFYSLHS